MPKQKAENERGAQGAKRAQRRTLATAPLPKTRDQQIGRVIWIMREEAGVSVDQAAAYLGISRKRYDHLEMGKSQVAVVMVERLAVLFGLPLHEVWLRVLEGAEPTPGTQGMVGTLLVNARPGQRLEIIIGES